MSKIDWKGELEAYHEDGRVVPVQLDQKTEQPDGSYGYRLEEALAKNPQQAKYFKPDGTQLWELSITNGFGRPWRIRNRQPTLTATDRLERLEAFVAKVAAIGGSAPVISEAKELVAEIAPPVDEATAYVESVFAQISDGGPMTDDGVKVLMKEAFEAGRDSVTFHNTPA